MRIQDKFGYAAAQALVQYTCFCTTAVFNTTYTSARSAGLALGSIHPGFRRDRQAELLKKRRQQPLMISGLVISESLGKKSCFSEHD